MNKKILIIVIAILAVILLAGVAAIFVLPDPTAPNAGNDLVAEVPAASVASEKPEQETDGSGASTEIMATEETVEDEQIMETSDADDPTDPTKKPDFVKPTTPAKDPTSPSQSNMPTESTPSTRPTAPQPTEPKPTEPGSLVPGMEEVEVPDSGEVTYEEYYAMSADEQASFINSFESYEAFFAWHAAAKKEYEEGRIEIDGSSPIDLGDLTGGN